MLISGDTNTETGFATLWRAGGKGRRWLVAPHLPPEEDRPIYSQPLTAAMRRADGFIVLADRHWDMLAVHHRLRGRPFVAPNGVAAEGEPPPASGRRGPPRGDASRIVTKTPSADRGAHDLADALTLSIYGGGPDREGWSRYPAVARSFLARMVSRPEPLSDADLLCVPSRSEALMVF